MWTCKNFTRDYESGGLMNKEKTEQLNVNCVCSLERILQDIRNNEIKPLDVQKNLAGDYCLTIDELLKIKINTKTSDFVEVVHEKSVIFEDKYFYKNVKKLCEKLIREQEEKIKNNLYLYMYDKYL